jgi:hypothetical protein
MSRAFVREQDIEALAELPDRLISSHPNDVTDEGMKQLELMLAAAREAHAAARGQDRSALAVASRICAIGAPGARPLVSFRALPIGRRCASAVR